jgi:CheY-like chemotaxis protein
VQRPINILAIDDDEVELDRLRRAFARSRLIAPLYTISDAERGLEMLRSGAVPGPRRLVLSDLHMPRMDGLELLREIRADADLRTIPVVIMTCSSAARDRLAAYELYAAGYIVKPVEFSALVEAITALVHYWEQMELPAQLASLMHA